MGISKLKNIFRPKRIAVIGVSPKPNSVGGITLKNLVSGGFRGVVYPVNPKHEAVLGITCFPNVNSLPKTPNLAIICTPAATVPGLVRECGEAGILGIIIMSAGFKEAGEQGKKLEEKIQEEISRFNGMRIIGPNCLGIILPGLQINASFANGMPKPGNVAFISQSGALCTSILDWALEENIGFSSFVSIGNIINVGCGDLIDYFGQDPNTKSIILYVESIKEVRNFMTAARAFSRKKPIIVYKAGRFPESAKAAAAHTGAMASDDAIYDAMFKRAGVTRVYEIGDIFDFTDLISRKRIPKGSNLAIITNAGGPGVMATDILISLNGDLANLSESTISKLDEFLPSYWSHGNPVDVLGDANPMKIADATKIVLDDSNVDAVLVIITPQAMTDPTGTAREIAKLSLDTSKPILAAWFGGKAMKEGVDILNQERIAVFQTPAQAIRAYMTLVSYSRNLGLLYETPKDIPVEFSIDRKLHREEFYSRFVGKEKILTEDVSKMLLRVYGIPTTMPLKAKTVEEAVRIANTMKYPVILKIFSPDISHKTDVGGVILNLEDEEMVRTAFDSMMDHVKLKEPKARLEGVTIQPMVDIKDAVELIVRIKKDPVFGTVILIGMGGTGSELFKEKVLGFPPLNERLVMNMLKSLKIFPLIVGYKDHPRKNIDKLVEVLIRISYLAADYPEIEELNIDPLYVTNDNVIALDASVVVDQDVLGKELKPYSHLALHPYPEKYVSTKTLRDGTEVLLRPIKPEDEPMWLELLGSCSKESIFSRFRYDFHYNAHEIATQFCFIDYDREMGIVAEIVENGQRKLIGVGRLIADVDHETVEYAVLITDSWQHKDLGKILTEYCINIASKWNLQRIVAQTTKDNQAMISVFRKLGFKLTFSTDSSVEVSKQL
ncbi:MAG: bifunctional acetate--CoA ligase family protein/GNAT family N-acetyltransferase [Bacteroidales bacterium]|nr:bifunctional acetate--CoA ligase family protein/GNAT family N-acetyltransferase [Bacteroidales bacterium]